jgi:hypothetical protein
VQTASSVKQKVRPIAAAQLNLSLTYTPRCCLLRPAALPPGPYRAPSMFDIGFDESNLTPQSLVQQFLTAAVHHRCQILNHPNAE